MLQKNVRIKSLLRHAPVVIMRLIMVSTTACIIILIAFIVCMRYIVKSDLYASEEIATLLAMWLYFISAGYASYENSHIRADILMEFVKKEMARKVIKCFNQGVAIIVLVFLVYWGIEFAAWSIGAGGKTAGWKIPYIYSQIPITIGFFIMLVYSIYHFIKIFDKTGGKQ